MNPILFYILWVSLIVGTMKLTGEAIHGDTKS